MYSEIDNEKTFSLKLSKLNFVLHFECPKH